MSYSEQHIAMMLMTMATMMITIMITIMIMIKHGDDKVLDEFFERV